MNEETHNGPTLSESLRNIARSGERTRTSKIPYVLATVSPVRLEELRRRGLVYEGRPFHGMRLSIVPGLVAGTYTITATA